MGLLLAVEGGATPPKGLDNAGTIVVEEQMRLGQAADNDLVLAEDLEGVAPHHCVIYSDDEGYHVIDHSAGRTFMNDSPTALSGEGPVALNIGDSLRIGQYQLTVMGASDIHAPRADTGLAQLPGQAVEPDLLDSVLMAEDQAVYAVRREVESPWDDEPVGLFSSPEDSHRDMGRAESRADHLDPMHHAYVAPSRRGEGIPDDWDFLAEIGGKPDLEAHVRAPEFPVSPRPRPQPEPEDITLLSPLPESLRGDHAPQMPRPEALRPIPQPAPRAPEARIPEQRVPEQRIPEPRIPEPRVADLRAPAPSRGDGTAALDAFARAAGLQPDDLPRGNDVQVMELAGRLLSAALGGLHMLMADNARLAHNFGLPAQGDHGHGARPGMSQTGDQNNPLALSGSSRDALRLLMRGNLPGFMPGDLAIAQACSEIAGQQELALRRMRQACTAVTESLSPDAIAALEPPQQGRFARWRAGSQNGFRRAYERRHREVVIDIGPISGSSVGSGRFAGGASNE